MLLNKGKHMFGEKTSEEWAAQYALSHQHPLHRLCHTIGSPLIAVSMGLFLTAPLVTNLW